MLHQNLDRILRRLASDDSKHFMLNLMASVVAGEQSIFIFRLMPFSPVYLTMCFASYEVKADFSTVHDRRGPLKTSDNVPVLERPSYNIVTIDSQEFVGK